MSHSHNPEIRKQGGGKLAELPRRQFLEFPASEGSLSQMRFMSFEAKPRQILISFFRWLHLLFDYLFHSFIDFFLFRDSPERRATRLRQAFERKGGSFIKLGIHLSLRLDFLPWVYCNELSFMTDSMVPFSTNQAVEIIERSTNRPLASLFSQFDPDPIISTSVACTYQAVMLKGENVIVKVRRPGIGEQFMADIRSFDMLLSIAEFLTIFRPGLTETMRFEFRNLLLEELDFIQEARRQDAFRRSAEESRKKFFSAPKVRLDLTTEEVIFNEFASGVWLWELLSGVERRDDNILTRIHEMNIDPHKVAKRLLWVNYWSWSENLFFHADPNPDNVIIGQDGILYFINFSTTGTLNRSQRQALRQNLKYAWERDPQNMARSSLILLEPLPPIDLIELIQELEGHNWQLIYALEASPQSVSWQERTSAIQWVGMVQIARKYGISIDIQVLRLIRHTLLLESMATRLYREIDYVEQFHKFNTFRAEQSRRKVTDSLIEQFDGPGNEQFIIRLDRIAQAIDGLIFQTSHRLSLPSVNFNALMSKWSFAFYVLARFLSQIGLTTLLFTIFIFIWFQSIQNFSGAFEATLLNPVYHFFVLVLIFINGRAVLYRMDDKEVDG